MKYEEALTITQFSRYKLVSLEAFMAIFHSLGLRDKCIASLLYFGSMRLENVLALKKNANCLTLLPSFVKKYSEKYLNTIDNESYYLFVNRRGMPVERTHISNALSRASRKVLFEVTPSQLTSCHVCYWNMAED